MSQRRPHRRTAKTDRRRFVSMENLEPRWVLDAAGISDDWLVRTPEPAPYEPGQLLVEFVNRQIAPSLDAWGIDGQLNATSRPGLWRIDLTSEDFVAGALQALRQDPSIRYAEPIHEVSLLDQNIPNDASFGQLWGMNNTGQSGGVVDADVDGPEAWSTITDAMGVIVADIDTGIDYRHPDLYKNIWINQGEIPATRLANLVDVDDDGLITFWDLNEPINIGIGKIVDGNSNGYIDGGDLLVAMDMIGGVDTGFGGWANNNSDDGDAFVDDLIGWDFINGDNDPIDDHNHGSHTTGTIAGIGNNGVGVAGVAWKAQVMPLKFLSASGSGSDLGGALSVAYAVAHGAEISSNSWGDDSGISQTLVDAISDAGTAGHLFVAAAGNNGRNIDTNNFYPAGLDLDNILSVASTTRTDARSSFSNYGVTRVDLGAPGSSIYSTVRNGGYSTFSGTSMATPHVAGAAALVAALQPDWGYAEIKDRLMTTTDPIASLQGLTVTGGRLNVAAAVDFSTPDPDPDPDPVDVVMVGTQLAPGGLSIQYDITGSDATPFEIGVYVSNDALADGGDTELGAVAVSDPADLSVGSHTLVVPVGSGAGAIALPGAGATESDDDYYLVAVADHLQQLDEDDADPLNEDNVAVVLGAYQASSGAVLVQGSDNADSIVVGVSGNQLTVNTPVGPYAFILASVTSIRVRSHQGADTIDGGASTKPIWGLAGPGNDLVIGGTAADAWDAGSGADTWRYNGTGAADTINLAKGVTGQIKITRSGVVDTFVYDSGDDVEVYGGASNDKLLATSNFPVALSMYGEAGNDALIGGAEDDLLDGGDGNDTLNGGAGFNTAIGGAGTDMVVFNGTSGVDYQRLVAGVTAPLVVLTRQPSASGAVTALTQASEAEKFNVQGANGNDTLDASAFTAADYVALGVKQLSLIGGNGDDLILGSQGADSINGGAGSDTIDGGGGVDVVTMAGSSGVDFMNLSWDAAAQQVVMTRQASSGGPVLEEDRVSGVQKLTMNGANGNDTLDASEMTAAHRSAAGITMITLLGGNGDDTLRGSQGVDTLNGGNQNDSIFGNDGNDKLIGGNGDDYLEGGAGNDMLTGNSGNDILLGGIGDDTLTAGGNSSLLIGGVGADKINGGTAGDLLIGGSTTFDANRSALESILLEWKRTDANYLTRVDHLRNGGGLNGSTLLTNSTVLDDGAVDKLLGKAGDDWFWAHALDTTDQSGSELVDP